MYSLNLTEEQLNTVFQNMSSHANKRVRQKCMVIYFKAHRYANKEIAKLLRIDEDSVTNYVKKYLQYGLEALIEENPYRPQSQLEPFREQLIKLFENTPPHTVNQAIEMIANATGVRLKHSACRAFLKRLDSRADAVV